ncbi:MAG: hypothetical protein CSA44_01795 [Gammaproteobacteria bacterium]|nr:MAG: hypothetical protein CSA44_01795 [Gammaproteobacteria bacterium]
MNNTIAHLAFSQLNQLWQDETRVWAINSEEKVTIAKLKQQTAQKVQALQNTDSTRCLIYRREKMAFVSDFMACLIAQVDIVLPANGQPNTIEQARKDANADTILADSTSMLAPESINTDIMSSTVTDVNITVFTSGSTGKPKAITKRLSAYLLEVEMLETLWGKHFASAIVLSSVSHQHIYGFIFGILLPLTFSHIIWSEQITFEERLHYLAGQTKKCVFIASPSILVRLSETLAKSSLQCVFSSGGVLTTEQAKKVEQHLNAPCLRIFGSSETGGIAWQNSQSDFWTAFPNVIIGEQDGLLLLTSPYSYQSPLVVADRIRYLDSQRFFLLGRADDIVKIGEKRVALTAVEQNLEKHDCVQKAKVIVLPKPRNCLAAVLVLSPEGKKQQQISPRIFYQSLRQSLNRQFERATLPKYFRCVEAFPENAQGKTLKVDLLALFSEIL